MSSHSKRVKGTIKWYSRKKGYGFVTPDNGGKDVFLHRSALDSEDHASVDTGVRIAFQVEQGQKGPSAAQVTRVEDSPKQREPQPQGQKSRTQSPEKPKKSPHPPEKAKPRGNISSFSDLPLLSNLQKAVRDSGYTEPTPIQAQSIPYLLEGRDLLGAAQTGTGKTAAFALPILQKLVQTQKELDQAKGHGKKRPKRIVRVLVVSPTRELAIQIGDFFSEYGKYTDVRNTVIYGGVGQNPQVQALQRGVDIIVATPGRLLDLMGQGYIHLDKVEILVLDEADRMLDMGFIHDMRRIIAAVPEKRQTLLFSATLPPDITQLASDILQNPIRVDVAPEQPTVEMIEQWVLFVSKKKKQDLLERILKDKKVTRALVFSRTKHGANRIVRMLKRAKISAEPIHGNKSQTARQTALKNFRRGKTRVLVATDVAARGIDVDDISHVIQFDLPNVPDTYIHRIGRTGRAGASGVALSFCSEPEESLLKDIEKKIKTRIPVMDHPI